MMSWSWQISFFFFFMSSLIFSVSHEVLPSHAAFVRKSNSYLKVTCNNDNEDFFLLVFFAARNFLSIVVSLKVLKCSTTFHPYSNVSSREKQITRYRGIYWLLFGLTNKSLTNSTVFQVEQEICYGGRYHVIVLHLHGPLMREVLSLLFTQSDEDPSLWYFCFFTLNNTIQSYACRTLRVFSQQINVPLSEEKGRVSPPR